MKAAYFTAYCELLEIGDVPDPMIGSGDALVRVRAVGICRSDWHGWQGHDSGIVSLPHIPGHEFAGEVIEVGSEVMSVRVGQRVTAPFACGCGRCGECSSGNAQVCRDQYQPGFHGAGAFAELVVVPNADFNVVPLPDAVEYFQAAALGCRFATAFRALAHPDQGSVQPGEVVAIFGCGGVGLSAVMVAKALGATVIAVDLKPAALKLATKSGADFAVAPEEVSEFVRMLDSGVQVTVDALGSAEVAREAIGLLRPRGRHLQVGLLLGKDAGPSMPMGKVIADELRIIGSHGMSAVRYPEMLETVADGKLQPGDLVGKRIGLEGIPCAMAEMGDFSASPGITVAEL